MCVALPWGVAGMGHRDRVVGDLPAVDSLTQRLFHGVLNRFEERVRHRSQLDLQAEFDAGVDRRWIDAQPDGSEKWIALLVKDLDRRPAADRPFNVNGRCLAESDVKAEVIGQGRLDDLLLHLSVKGDEQLLPNVILPEADQRVLLPRAGRGQDGARPWRGGGRGDDDGLQRRRGRNIGAQKSTIWISLSPQSLPICPAETNGRRAA